MVHAGVIFRLTVVVILAAYFLPSISYAVDTAPVDSTLIATFLALPDDELDNRQSAARAQAKKGLRSTNGPERLDLLGRAAEEDPARTRHWLDLAETQMDMGYLEKVEISLKSARVTIDFLTGDERKEAVRDFSLAMGWFHFELGNWEDGRKWGARAVKYKAGQEGHLVHKLNSARPLGNFEEMKEACNAFRPLDSGSNRRINMSWCYLMHFYLNNYDFDEMDASSWLRKGTHHYQRDVTRWRDYGIYCEANQSAQLAVGYFEKSFQVMKIRDGGWLTRMDHAIPSVSASPAVMPFWVNRDQGYVTGSLLAYLGFLHDRMTTGATPADRQRWAARLRTYGSRAENRYPYRPWVSLWLSEALLVLDEPWEAENVIEISRATFKALDISDPHLDRVHGHILLLVNQAARAEPMIRRAAAHFPDDGACWTDLGLVEVMARNRAAALQAFDRALEIDPELAVAWYNRGLMKSHDRRFEEAVADVEQAALLRPDDPEIDELLVQLKNRVSLEKRD